MPVRLVASRKSAKAKFDLDTLADEEAADTQAIVGQPTLMTHGELRDYQKSGVAWLTSL
jgi:SNF2 family DNA or RNA helicase